MNANEMADLMILFDSGRIYEHSVEIADMLRQQADRIGVLEANHKIQLKINEKALQYIAELEKGLEASLNLNRAQNERK